jgi:hypothetical protein
MPSTLEFPGLPIPVFTIGPPLAPKIEHDNGHLGAFPARRPTAADYAELTRWVARLEVGEAIQGVPFLPKNDLPDALAAYRHFLFGKGKARTLSYERYISSDPSGEITLHNASAHAQLAAEQLFLSVQAAGKFAFDMTSRPIHCGLDPEESAWGELYPYPQTENWQKTIGAHYLWLSARVNGAGTPTCTNMTMYLTLHVEDRYNFNPGIPDEANGRFELAGLGTQYTNYALVARMVRWTLLSSQRTTAMDNYAGRLRRPAGNRRLRNRL